MAQFSTEPRSVAFRKKRENSWIQLELLVDKAFTKGLHVLNHKELMELPLLYRQAIFSLSVARSTSLDKSTIAYLDALCARAYLLIYSSRKPSQQVFRIFLLEIPRTIRKYANELFLSFFLFVVGIGLAWVLTNRDPHWFHSISSSKEQRTPWSSREELKNTLYTHDKNKKGLASFSSLLFSNNAKVSILAFASGFLAGIPTALLLLYNGMILGAFLATFARHGLLYECIGWLMVHGVPELTAIVLSGAGGFVLGKAILFPKQRTRIFALKSVGGDASIIMVGVIFLLFVAALFEGFFRQLVNNDTIRYLFIVINFAWVFFWIFGVGRSSKGEKISS